MDDQEKIRSNNTVAADAARWACPTCGKDARYEQVPTDPHAAPRWPSPPRPRGSVDVVALRERLGEIDGLDGPVAVLATAYRSLAVDALTLAARWLLEKK